MGGADQVVAQAWNEWGIQALVLLSFTLQVALLISGELRRRVDSGVLRFFVWSAYMLADATAIYVLGHMSVTSRMPEHQLMAFWAPFLLLHLGGQDNITAYAIEDNRLWLRHLQTLAVQVAAAGYVLYQSSIFGGSHSSLLSWATILMFVVGAVKYGESVWTLRSAGSSPMGKKYRTFEPSAATMECQYYLDNIISTSPWDTEGYLLMAHHRMLDVPMDLLRGPLGLDNEVYPFAEDMTGKDLYKVVEMQLSLMHDVFYTKLAVMHSNLYGLCIRILLAVATAAAFLLFHLLIIMGKDNGYSSLDVAVTYVLLVGAVVLETSSLLGAMFSSWTCPLLVRWSRDKYGMEDHTLCNYLGRIVTSLRRLVHAADWRRRYWSGSIGQHNLLQLAAGTRVSSITKIARRMGFEDSWNTIAYSCSIPVSAFLEDLLVNQVLKGECASVIGEPSVGEEEDVFREEGSEGRPADDIDHQLFYSRGPAELKRWGLYKGGLTWSVEERIVVWHIATNVYLGWWYKKHTEQPEADDAAAKAVEVLSNYMMFLLATRPYMLSPTASRNSYLEICYGLTTRGPRYRSAEELASVLWSYGADLLTNTASSYTSHRKYGFELDFTTQDHLRLILQTGCKLGAKLISKDVELQEAAAGTLKVLAQVWVEMLCYAAQRCSKDSHAKQLSNGGDLITVAALLVKYLRQSHFPTAGTHFNPRRWHRGGPFGSPSDEEADQPALFHWQR